MKPSCNGAPAGAITIGIVRVAPIAARIAGVKWATMIRRWSGRRSAGIREKDLGPAARALRRVGPRRGLPAGPRHRVRRGAALGALGAAVASAPAAFRVRVWQITSGADGHPGGDRRRSVLMLLTLTGGRRVDQRPARARSPDHRLRCGARARSGPLAETAGGGSRRAVQGPRGRVHRARRPRPRAGWRGAAHRGARRRRSPVHPGQRNGRRRPGRWRHLRGPSAPAAGIARIGITAETFEAFAPSCWGGVTGPPGWASGAGVTATRTRRARSWTRPTWLSGGVRVSRGLTSPPTPTSRLNSLPTSGPSRRVREFSDTLLLPV